MDGVKRDMNDLYLNSFSDINEDEPGEHNGLAGISQKAYHRKLHPDDGIYWYITKDIKALTYEQRNKARKSKTEGDWSKFRKMKNWAN